MSERVRYDQEADEFILIFKNGKELRLTSLEADYLISINENRKANAEIEKLLTELIAKDAEIAKLRELLRYYFDLWQTEKRKVETVTTERDRELQAAYCAVRQVKDVLLQVEGIDFTSAITAIDEYTSGRDKYSGVYDELAAVTAERDALKKQARALAKTCWEVIKEDTYGVFMEDQHE